MNKKLILISALLFIVGCEREITFVCEVPPFPDAVKVIMNGEGELKKITIENVLLKESKEIVEDLIVAAHNDARSKLKKKTTEEISKVTGGIDLPPGFKLPF